MKTLAIPTVCSVASFNCKGGRGKWSHVRGSVLSLSLQGCSYHSGAESLGVRPHAVELDGPFPWPLLSDPIVCLCCWFPFAPRSHWRMHSKALGGGPGSLATSLKMAQVSDTSASASVKCIGGNRTKPRSHDVFWVVGNGNYLRK